MRIITGKFKKANLFSVPGKTARPTTDYTKEVIFSTIFSCVSLEILDLFAGSGSLGLEALSRGAEFVDFVEFSEKSIKTILRNIQKLKCENETRVYRKKVESYLKKTEKKYDLIFMDPPYDKNMVNKTINLIISNSILKKNGKIIIEHSSNEKINCINSEIYANQKRNGSTMITILENISQNEADSS